MLLSRKRVCVDCYWTKLSPVYSIVASQKTTPRRFHEKVCIYCQPTGKDRGGGSLPQSGVPLNTGSAWSLFKEIMHKHRGELQHLTCTDGAILVHAQLENMAIHTSNVQKWWKSPPWEETLVYNESEVHGEISIEPSRLLPPAPGSLNRGIPLVLQTILGFSLKRQFWHTSVSGIAQGWKEV